MEKIDLKLCIKIEFEAKMHLCNENRRMLQNIK